MEAAVLASVAAPLVDWTVLVSQANVLGVLLHRALEEAFAALAGAHAVVLASSVIAAHGAQLNGRYCVMWRRGCRGTGADDSVHVAMETVVVAMVTMVSVVVVAVAAGAIHAVAARGVTVHVRVRC